MGLTVMDAELEVFHPAIGKAANWLREKYNISEDCSIVNEFAKEFNCEYRYVSPEGTRGPTVAAIKFETESDKLLFLIRSMAWS